VAKRKNPILAPHREFNPGFSACGIFSELTELYRLILRVIIKNTCLMQYIALEDLYK